MKFSELVTAASTADDTVKAEQAKLTEAQLSAATGHSAVVDALKGKTPNRVALAQPDGTVNEVVLNADSTDFTVNSIPGDFDIA